MAGFKVEWQAPRPRIEIIPPPYDGGVTVWLTPQDTGTAAGGRHIASNNLLSYSFSEAVDDLAGSFSFSVENETVTESGASLFDLIPLRCVVNIYEADLNTPVFRGIIRKRRNSGSMTADGPGKSTVFSGNSIIACITEFMVPLDLRISGVKDAIAKSKELQTHISGEEWETGIPIKSFMQKTWEHFRAVSKEVANANTELINLIDGKYIGSDFIRVTGRETSLKYPVATIFYNQANNYITDVWRNILPGPVYELFSRFDDEEKRPVIVARQVPFGDPDNGNTDWSNLKPLYGIDPVSLTAYDLEQGDGEVYTAFAAYVIGSPKAKEFYQVVSEKVDPDMEINEAKSGIYGFKLLSVSFTGFDRMNNVKADERKNKLTSALKKLNKKTKYWYSRLDEMYSGTITLITNFKDKTKNPKAGGRVGFLGGEFYVEKSEHSWSYGKTPVNRLTVSRGMVYDSKGKIEGEIPGVGKLYGELKTE